MSKFLPGAGLLYLIQFLAIVFNIKLGLWSQITDPGEVAQLSLSLLNASNNGISGRVFVKIKMVKCEDSMNVTCYYYVSLSPLSFLETSTFL